MSEAAKTDRANLIADVRQAMLERAAREGVTRAIDDTEIAVVADMVMGGAWLQLRDRRQRVEAVRGLTHLTADGTLLLTPVSRAELKAALEAEVLSAESGGLAHHYLDDARVGRTYARPSDGRLLLIIAAIPGDCYVGQWHDQADADAPLTIISAIRLVSEFLEPVGLPSVVPAAPSAPHEIRVQHALGAFRAICSCAGWSGSFRPYEALAVADGELHLTDEARKDAA